MQIIDEKPDRQPLIDQLVELQAELEHKSKVLDDVHAKLKQLQEALNESIKFQSHYAELLNIHDGGERIIFKNSEQWIKRLQALQGKEEGEK